MRQPLQSRRTDYVLIALIMGLMGAFFWAIRGTTGFGGSSGGALAGLGWATLWLAFSRLLGDAPLRPYGNGRAFAAITFGIAFGGLTGYGVYTAWVNGIYQMNRELDREISVWMGYGMFFLCGIHWGGNAGAFLSWAAPTRPVGIIGWVARVAIGLAGAWLGASMVGWFPEWFLPFYGEGYYQNEDYTTSLRAMDSAATVMRHVGLFAGFLLAETLRRDWRAVQLMLVMSLGFALPFSIGGYGHTFRSVDLAIDWWKNWEMTIGLFGGLAFGLAFYRFNRPTLNRPTQQAPRPTSRLERIFGIGFTMWLAFGIVVLGAYEGFINSRGLKESLESTRDQAYWAYVAVATIIGLVWIYRTMTMSPAKLASTSPIPMSVLAAIVVVIIFAGYLTSIPSEMRMAHQVLLALYTGYITASGILLTLFLKRQNRSGISA